ncbi:MAG: hypothetical protein Kow0065_06260 [Methylomicrobium sp.]
MDVDDKTLMAWLKSPEGFFRVMTVPTEIAQALGANTRQVVLSPDTLVKNRQHHPDLTDSDYAKLDQIGENPTIAVKDGNRTVVLVKQDSEIYWTAIKATQTGKALFLTSFRKSQESDVKRLLRKGQTVFGEWEK